MKFRWEVEKKTQTYRYGDDIKFYHKCFIDDDPKPKALLVIDSDWGYYGLSIYPTKDELENFDRCNDTSQVFSWGFLSTLPVEIMHRYVETFFIEGEYDNYKKEAEETVEEEDDDESDEDDDEGDAEDATE